MRRYGTGPSRTLSGASIPSWSTYDQGEAEPLSLLSRLGRPRRGQIAGTLRVFVYFSVVLGALSLVGARAALAHTEEALFSFGRNLAGLEALTDKPHRVRINGQLMNVQHATVLEALDDVVRRVHEHCEAGDALADPLFIGSEGLSPAISDDTTVWTRRKDGEVIAACFVRPAGAAHGLSERLEAFASTLDVSEFGLFRYVFARELAPGKTSVLTMWLSEPFRLDALIGSGGQDAPGSDPLDAPRPANATRLLTIRVEDSPYATYIYRSSDDTEPLASDFNGRALAMGWQGTNSLGRGKGHEGGAYFKQGLLMFTSFSPLEDGSVIAMTTSAR